MHFIRKKLQGFLLGVALDMKKEFLGSHVDKWNAVRAKAGRHVRMYFGW